MLAEHWNSLRECKPIESCGTQQKRISIISNIVIKLGNIFYLFDNPFLTCRSVSVGFPMWAKHRSVSVRFLMPGKPPDVAATLVSTIFQSQPITPIMGRTWVQPSFKNILIDACQEYLNTTDKGKEKLRSALITRVAEEIRLVVAGTADTLPEDTEKVHYHRMHIYCTAEARK